MDIELHGSLHAPTLYVLHSDHPAFQRGDLLTFQVLAPRLCGDEFHHVLRLTSARAPHLHVTAVQPDLTTYEGVYIEAVPPGPKWRILPHPQPEGCTVTPRTSRLKP